MPNPLGKVVNPPTGRRLVIPDIHGCLNTLTQLIRKIDLQKEDVLFFLGDYVNKGPSGKGVLDFIIALQKQYTVYPLLGNHDVLLQQHLSRVPSTDEQAFDEFEGISGEESAHYQSFLNGLHHYFICGDFILVHAGLNFNLANPFLGTEDMLNIRAFYYDSAKAQNKSIVHGHQPMKLTEIISNIQERNKIIPLDNGCVYAGKREGMGHLLCVNLDDMSLTLQEYCD